MMDATTVSAADILEPAKKIEEAADDWENKTDELISALNKLDPSFDAATKKIKDLIRSIVEQIKLAKKEEKLDKKVLDVTSKLEKATRSLSKSVSATTAVTSGSTAAASAAGGGGKGKPPSKVAGAFGDSFSSAAKALKKGNLAGIAVEVTNAWKPMGMMFAGLVKDEVEFMQQMRKIAYVTQGITGDFQDQQEAFQYLGRTVNITGQNLSVFQKEYVKNLQRGAKTQKEMLKITKTGLHVSTMVGDTSNEIADTLATWHMTMGLSVGKTAQLGRGIQTVARETGVMGANLARAVKSSESILTTMRNLGKLTATSAKNVIGLLASAEKIGVGEQMKELATAAGSFHDLLYNTNPQTQTLMYNIASAGGAMRELYDNTLLTSREGVGKLAKGIEGVVKEFGSLEGVTIDMDPSDVSANMNLAMKATYGKTFGELKRMWQAAQEQSKPFAERISKINETIKDQNTTAKEKLKLEKDLVALQLSRGFEFIDRFQEAADGSKTMQEAMGKVSKAISKDKDMMTDLAAAGYDVSNSMEVAKGSLLFGADKLRAAGGKDFTSQIKKAFASNDLKAQKEIMEQMSEEQQKMVMEQNKSLDPITNISNIIMEINEQMRGFFGPAMRAWLGILAPLGAIAATLAQLLIYSIGTKQLLKWFGASFAKFNTIKATSGLAGAGGAFVSSFKESLNIFGKAAKDVLGGFKDGSVELFKGLSSGFKGLMNSWGITWAYQKVQAGIYWAGQQIAAGAYWAWQGVQAGVHWAQQRAQAISTWFTNTKAAGGFWIFQKAQAGIYWTGQKIAAGAFWAWQKAQAMGSWLAGTKIGKVAGAVGGRIGGGLTKFGGGVGRGVSGFANKALGGFGQAGTKIAGLFGGAGGGTGATAIAGIAGKLAVPLAIVTTGLAGLFNGLEAGAKANEVFGISLEEVTKNQRMAAESAGFLTGMLNFLTFGLFQGALGPTGSLTKMLAKLLAVFPPLSWVIQAVMIPFKILWGVLKGLWEFVKNVFIGIWDGIKIIFEAFAPIGDAVGEIFAAFSDAFSAFIPAGGEGLSIIGALTWVLGGLGKVVGAIIKVLASIVAFVIKLFVAPIAKGISYLAVILKPVFRFFAAIVGVVWDTINGIIAPFKWLYDTLVGNSIIPDLIQGIVGWFEWMVAPIKLVISIIKDHVIGGFKILGEYLSGMWDVIAGIFTLDFGRIGGGITKMFKAVFISLPKLFFTTFSKMFLGLGKFFIDRLKNIFIDFPKWWWNTLTGSISKLKSLHKWLYDTFTDALQKVWDWLTGKLTKKTEAEEDVRVAKEGKSVIQGVVRTAGGAKDVITGGGEGRMAGIRHVAKGVAETSTSKVGRFALGPMWAAGVGITDALGITSSGPKKAESPKQKVPAFAEGTTMITRGGLAVIHSGEQINPARATASAAPVNDVYDRMRQEQVTQTGVVAKTPQIGKLESINQEQANLLDQINSGISTLVSLMKPSDIITSGPGVTAESRSQTTPSRSTDYAKWQYGMQSSNPGVQRVNNGQ